jgi:hypothetical protein
MVCCFVWYLLGFNLGLHQCWVGIYFLIPFEFNFHKRTYKKVSIFHFLLFSKNNYTLRQGINFLKKIESALTMSVLVNLRSAGYHLAVLTNRLLLVCERV